MLKTELFGYGLAVVDEDESIRALENGQADMLILANEYENVKTKVKMVKLETQSGCKIETLSDSYTLIQQGWGWMPSSLPKTGTI